MIRKLSLFFAVIGFWFLMLDLSAFAAGEPPAEGSTLPPVKLSIPKSPEEKSYLGLT